MAVPLSIAEFCAALIELIGIVVITATAVVVTTLFIFKFRHGFDQALQSTRQRLGFGIMLGLEFLVAADIIETVAIDLTFSSIGALGLIVLIRTFLSFTLHVEVTGQWPWRKES